MSRYHSSCLLTATVAALIGCAEAVAPATSVPSPDVLTFIADEGLHRVQQVRVLLDIPAHRTQVFRVVYGDSLPVSGLCERGCGYAFPVGIGLRRDTHVGWLSVADTARRSRFDFDSADEYLFSEEFFERFEQADQLLFQQSFKALLAADVDTPNSALRLLVGGLSTWISPWIAGLLLDNPSVAQHCEMLVQMSRLPVFQGDAYGPARDRAANMLVACD